MGVGVPVSCQIGFNIAPLSAGIAAGRFVAVAVSGTKRFVIATSRIGSRGVVVAPGTDPRHPIYQPFQSPPGLLNASEMPAGTQSPPDIRTYPEVARHPHMSESAAPHLAPSRPCKNDRRRRHEWTRRSSAITMASGSAQVSLASCLHTLRHGAGGCGLPRPSSNQIAGAPSLRDRIHDSLGANMPTDRVIVIGASSGGVSTLTNSRRRFAALGTSMSVVRVSGIGPHAPGILHQTLARAGESSGLQGAIGHAASRTGYLCCSPGFSFVSWKDKLRITRGPRENRFRPAIDPLFRSAAYSYGRGAIGIVLTGNLDDGTSGLWSIKENGGVALVQNPAEALYPSMPRSAIQHVPVDHVVPIAAVPPLLLTLTTHPIGDAPVEHRSAGLRTEVQIATGEDAREVGVLQLGEPSMYTCPDCHGVLLEVRDSGVPRFRCHTGHAYSIDSLAATVFEKTEDAMWSAIRALDEGGSLLQKLARHVEEHHDDHGAATLRERAMLAKRRADLLQRSVAGDPSMRLNEGFASQETPAD